MKRSFKALLLAFSIFLIFVLTTACNSNPSADTTKNTAFISKTVNNLNIKMNKIATSKNAKGDQNMVEIHMTILNKDSGEVGIGANDFKIKADGKSYKVYPQANNFGDVIKPEQKLTGSAFFELPEDIKKAELIYEINQKEAAIWKIIIPKAE